MNKIEAFVLGLVVALGITFAPLAQADTGTAFRDMTELHTDVWDIMLETVDDPFDGNETEDERRRRLLRRFVAGWSVAKTQEDRTQIKQELFDLFRHAPGYAITDDPDRTEEIYRHPSYKAWVLKNALLLTAIFSKTVVNFQKYDEDAPLNLQHKDIKLNRGLAILANDALDVIIENAETTDLHNYAVTVRAEVIQSEERTRISGVGPGAYPEW